MNVLLLSPGFPPHLEHFCTALKARGATVLGVGDIAEASLTATLRASLDAYVFEPAMWEYDRLREAVLGLVASHGPLHRVDSLMEHWLGHEARLRDDFGVWGLGAEAMAKRRSKTGMAELFARADIAHPPGMRVDTKDDLDRAVEAFGLPLVVKPDTGSGATATFAIGDRAALEVAHAKTLTGMIAQPFIEGDIVTYDGLTNDDGEIVFSLSHTYDAGIMEVVTGQLDGHYYNLRDIPPKLEALGRRAVAAFDLPGRFFHAEFFHRDDDTYVALEMNLRPPGGFTTDMMNLACNFDVYALWAGVTLGARYEGFSYERAYHVAHAGRRRDRVYRVAHAALVAALGDTLQVRCRMPEAFASTMGDDVYLLRHAELATLREAIALVHAV